MARARQIRRSIAVGGLSLGSLALLAPAAEAVSNFGGWLYGSPVSHDYGGRVAIQTPPNATTEIANDNEIFAHRVAIENWPNPFNGLAQTGLYRSGRNVHVDNCDQSVDKYTYYAEVLAAAYPPTFKCALYGQAPFGNDTEFKVSGDGTGRYQLSGANVQTGQTYTTPWVQLWFNNGFNYISSEINNDSNNVIANGSTLNAQYGGGAGPEPSWYAYTQPNYGGVHRVTQAEVSSLSQNFSHAGNWYEGTLPTPIRFKHTP
jgi:hypothetical protein